MRHLLLQADARRIPLADKSVHLVITSPPYHGLRDYGVNGQIGLEELHDCLGWATGDRCWNCFVCSMVRVFREVWRVMRDDAVAFVNLGDSYNAYNGGAGPSSSLSQTQSRERPQLPSGYGLKYKSLKPKDLVGIPWRTALALQADGFYLRSDIIWAKKSPMPESVTDRPTKAHEYLFLLAKSDRYFYDADAVKEPMASGPSDIKKMTEQKERIGGHVKQQVDPLMKASSLTNIGQKRSVGDPTMGRNLRSVWTLGTDPYPGAHFATYPRKLVEPCIKAGTSEKGCCPSCGSSWRRVTERTAIKRQRPNDYVKRSGEEGTGNSCANTVAGVSVRTIGWEPTCPCPEHTPVPCTVLDPFNGSGTTGVVALAHGRNYVGLDLNRDYLGMARRRIERPHAPVERPAEDEPLPLFQH